MALQFFDWSIYPESDLDIYMEHCHALVVAQWLRKIGYTFVPRKHQEGVLEYAFEDAPDTFPVGSGVFRSEEVGYFSHGVAGFSISVNTIQTTKSSSLLPFTHQCVESDTPTAACVKNIITHDSTYVLYLIATFEWQ
jgi:hypothetical protein